MAEQIGSQQDGSKLSAPAEGRSGELGEQINFVKEALKWQYNWIGLAGAAAFALVSGTGLPIILAAGLELIYVSTVPQSSRFRRLVRSWKYAEEKRQLEIKLNALFQELPSEMRKRYADLAQVCDAIRANFGQLSSTSQMLFVKQMEDELQGMLQAYLRLLQAAVQHSEYLRTTSPETIKRELAQLQRELAAETPQLQGINRKRIEILTKRLEKFEKIRENQQVVNAQCAAVEDLLELIRDQSVTMRDPQQVSNQLENLVHEVEQTEETVRQVESIFELAVPDKTDTIEPLSIESVTSAVRSRMKN